MGPLQSSISAMTLTSELTADVSAIRFVTVFGTQAGAGEDILGVSRYAGKPGDAIAVDTIAAVDMVAGAAIERGKRVQSDADGLPVTKADGADAGLALTAALNPGDIVKILVK